MRLLSYGPHVTLVMWYTVTVTVTRDMITCDHPSHQKKLWYCDKVMWLFPALHLVIVSPIKEKEKEKKRNINNNLAILPSYDTTSLLSFLVPRNFSTTHSIGLPCCPFHFHLPLSILDLLNFLPLPGSSLLSLFLPVSCPSIISNFFLTFSNIPGRIACPTIHICHDLANWLNHYFLFFSFSFIFWIFFFFFFFFSFNINGCARASWLIGKHRIKGQG